MPIPHEHDLRGLKCPMPVLRTRKALVGVPSGTTVTIIADDPLAVIDIPHFVRTEGHELVSQEPFDTGFRFQILKRP